MTEEKKYRIVYNGLTYRVQVWEERGWWLWKKTDWYFVTVDLPHPSGLPTKAPRNFSKIEEAEGYIHKQQQDNAALDYGWKVVELK